MGCVVGSSRSRTLSSFSHFAVARSGTTLAVVCEKARVASASGTASFMKTSLSENVAAGLGKMRQEVVGQVVAREQGCRRFAGELAEIADQVRWIVVAAGSRGRSPTG